MEGILQQLMRLRSHIIEKEHVWRHVWKWTCAVVGQQQFAEQTAYLLLRKGEHKKVSFSLLLIYTELTYMDVLIQDARQRKDLLPFMHKKKSYSRNLIYQQKPVILFILQYHVMISTGLNGIAIAISKNNVLWMLKTVPKLWPWDD